MKRELFIKEIIEELSILKNKIELLSSINFQDLNIISEYHIQEILNIMFNFDLKNVNIKKHNIPAIDLEDTENSIAVQITSTNKKVKIQETLNKFLEYGLNKKYSILLVFILGKKQNTYKNLILKDNFNFVPEEHIIDLSNIISRLTILPTSKIEKIRNILKNDKIINKNKNAVSDFKKRQSIRNKIAKKLLRKNLKSSDSEILFYSPYYKFIYDKLIIRSIEDTSYPNIDDNESHPISTWFKAEIHDLYEYGIEIMCLGSEYIVVDKEGKWNCINNRNTDELSNNLKIIRTGVLQRIPYEYIIELDMIPDDIYEYPTLFVEYKNEKKHFSEQIPFIIGYYNSEKDYRKVTYFELKDRVINL